MNRWRVSKQVSTFSVARSMTGVFFGVIVFMVIYFSIVRDQDYIVGIPVPMVAITIVAPILLSGLIFWFARVRERHDWRIDDEE